MSIPEHSLNVKKNRLFFNGPVLSWAMYDFANTIFSSNIITIFFPFYITATVGGSPSMDQMASTVIGYANAFVSVFLVLLSPFFGVWMDRSGSKKKYLAPFAFLAIVFTFLMAYCTHSPFSHSLFSFPMSTFLVILAFMGGKFCYQSSLVFYDGMLADISNKNNTSLISGFGVAVGYTGTLMGLAVYPLAGPHDFQKAFLYSAILFLLFSLPMFLFYKDPVSKVSHKTTHTVPSGFSEISQTFKEMKQYRSIFLLMGAYFFFNDAIATAIAMMAPYAATVIGFSQKAFIFLYLVATVFSIAGAFMFGYITKKVGSRAALFGISLLLAFALFLAVVTTNSAVFWIAGALYGISMGSMWVVTRTMIIEMAPEGKKGQFFGLFAFSGKISAIVGPFVYGSITLLLAHYGAIASRAALSSLLLFVAAGVIILRFVKSENAQ